MEEVGGSLAKHFHVLVQRDPESDRLPDLVSGYSSGRSQLVGEDDLPSVGSPQSSHGRVDATEEKLPKSEAEKTRLYQQTCWQER